MIIIENKFFADFSKGDQIKRYLEILENDSEHQNKSLFLLTIKNRKDYLENKIKEQLGSSNLKVYFQDKNVKYETVFWDDIFKLFQSEDIFLSELSKFVRENYIVNSKIGAEEVELINSIKIPNLLKQINEAIVINRDYMANHGYKVTRMTRAKDCLYYLEFSWGLVCVEYFQDFWHEYHTPFSLQLMDVWNKKILNLNKLRELEFIENKTYGYILPISISGEDINDSFNDQVLHKVMMIQELFGS
ncbi:PD-(D/E)XK nuclease family protein [Spirochaeta cellobiosiphila]|uniref:PD-(D/E)XK nuclease family protein n=1 Tax=Spirochaeta cellobiosiphila TaxID=504483 RepID=UPI00041C4F45|nr:PD-(D/E)XK nuclease family protein [Spirochaeta cellobiosiphila]